MKTARWFWAVVAAQVLFLGLWAGYHEGVRQHSPVILLKTRPVDPQDLLRGDYMILGYDIGRVPASDIAGKLLSRDVWVLLEKRDGYHVVVAASDARLHPKWGQVLVRGTAVVEWRDDKATHVISYGIERYFVPEGKGTPRFKTLEVEASVSPTGHLYIRRLLLDGKAHP